MAALSVLIATAPAASVPAAARRVSSYPSKITGFTAVPGPNPGEITLRWKTQGRVSSGFVVESALTPYSPFTKKPRKGWKWTSFSFPAQTRTAVLSPAQTARAGAGQGTARELVLRIYNKGWSKGKKVIRWRGPSVTSAAGAKAPEGSGSSLLVGTYNIRLHGLDASSSDNAWAKRVPRIAAAIKQEAPAVVGVQELTPVAVGDFLSGLRQHGLSRYRLTRKDQAARGIPGDARILYDSSVLTMVSSCPEQPGSCATQLMGNIYAMYAKFAVAATGEQFWYVSAHLKAGGGREREQERGRQTNRLIEAIDTIMDDGSPVMIAADLNSHQIIGNGNLPQSRLLAAGFYDTAAAVRTKGLAFGTVNHFEVPRQKASKMGFGARLDVVMTRGMPGADAFWNLRNPPGTSYPSDHNLVLARVRLP